MSYASNIVVDQKIIRWELTIIVSSHYLTYIVLFTTFWNSRTVIMINKVKPGFSKWQNHKFPWISKIFTADKSGFFSNNFLTKLEPVISMSPEHISVIPKFSQIKFGPIRISKNGPNWQYRNVFNLGEFWNNRNVFRTHLI